MLACGLALLLAIGYGGSDFTTRLLLVGAVLGFVAGALWGSRAAKRLLEALMNL